MDLSGLIEAKDLALTAEKPYKFFVNRVQIQLKYGKKFIGVFLNEMVISLRLMFLKVLSLLKLKLKVFMSVTMLSRAKFIYRLKNLQEK